MILAGLGMAYFAYQRSSKPPMPAALQGGMPEPPASLRQPESLPPPVLDEEALAKVRASTQDSDPAVRWQAAQFLNLARDRQADQILVNMLRADDSPQVRRDVVTLLSNRNDKAMVRYILLALKDTEVEVRLAALAAIARVGDSSAANDVSEALKDVDERVRLAALQTLNTLQTNYNAEVDRIQRERVEYQRKLEEYKKLHPKKR